MKLHSQTMDNDWQDLAIVVLGLWLYISPFLLQYISTSPAAAISSFIIGTLMIGIAMLGLSTHQFWEEWGNLVFAVFLVASPWLLGFTAIPLAMWNAIIVGTLVAICNIWAMIQWRSEHHVDQHPSRA